MIPTELKMEDLSRLEKLLPTLMLNLTFVQGDRDISHRTALNRKLYIRLLDKAIDEYNEARELIVAQIAEKQQRIYMFKFVDHMENCISSVRRILRFLNILKGNRDGLTFSRIIKNHIESLTSTSSIVEMRNTLEHMDERIRDDVIQEDEPIMLKISGTQDAIVIGSHSLKFSDLSTLIKKLHEIGQGMAGWRKSDGP